MSDLRKAAELALTALDATCPNTWHSVRENLRQALAQTEWVGLTRQEAEDVVDDFITIGGDVENWAGYWQAIEAKLKEKNA